MGKKGCSEKRKTLAKVQRKGKQGLQPARSVGFIKGSIEKEGK